MIEHQILFRTPMVQAILEGRKTQTRRVCQHQHWAFSELTDVNVNGICQKVDRNVSCPYGQPGDRLWVREKTIINNNSNTYWPVADGYVKTADYEKTIPSIHMPKAAARIWLEIEEVKVERVQDINDKGAIAEGVLQLEPGVFKGYNPACNFPNYIAKSSFKELWITTGGDWYGNPWVWVIKFKVLSTTGAVNIQAL